MYHYVCKFTLRTDHKPLIKKFAPDSATPVLAAARLQQWSLFLSSYHYGNEYNSSAEVSSADALSRLPLQYRRDASVEDSIYHVTAQLHNHPVTAAAIARKTAQNPMLSKALTFTQLNRRSIDSCTDPDLKPFIHRHHELSVEQNCLMWGLVPPSFQPPVLAELIHDHPDVAR